ncbi:MAG: GAF domain-containing protein [Spirochaetales bacterium]|nr:GAF domain-containing protein [Spirochaetales bacterium]
MKNSELFKAFSPDDAARPPSSPAEEMLKTIEELYHLKDLETLLIDDVYALEKDVPYAFNREFDDTTGYRTRSMLTVPIAVRDGRLLGVLQLINAEDKLGRVVPFSSEDTLYITQFANNAAYAIENAKLTREMAFRMVEIAALRDPAETAAHAERVSALSAELYTVWGKKRNIDQRERRHTRESLRIAAILHDVGKVAVSDTVPKKPGELTAFERRDLFLGMADTVVRAIGTRYKRAAGPGSGG